MHLDIEGSGTLSGPNPTVVFAAMAAGASGTNCKTVVNAMTTSFISSPLGRWRVISPMYLQSFELPLFSSPRWVLVLVHQSPI